ncbi:MAG: M23 family metallopeptidase [Oceanococcaceae bacterium]
MGWAINGWLIDSTPAARTSADSSNETLARMNPIAQAMAHVPETSILDLQSPPNSAAAGVLTLPIALSDEVTINTALAQAPAVDNQPEPATSPSELPPAEASAYDTLMALPIRRGDSLSALLTQAGIDAADWLAVSRMPGDARKLRLIQPGKELHIHQDGGRLLHLEYPLSVTQTIVIERDGEQFRQFLRSQPTQTVLRSAAGTVESNLYTAARDAGISDNVVMTFAEIFAWDIDFSRDVRAGDVMRVVYEEQIEPQSGRTVGSPVILAAEYTQAQRAFTAVRYESLSGDVGYFTPDGRPVRKAFLRTPVEFARISSRFSLSRRHPVLNTVRAHKGVDYAAARGTPIRATGDGRVAFAGTKGGYGRTVIIKHNDQYQTLYAHMSRYGRGIGGGARVKQGQVIGYVGATGLATGPHLHYEFHKNGQHVDPLRVTLPNAAPLPETEMARFQDAANTILTQLAQADGSARVAQAAP